MLFRSLGPDHPDVATMLNNLALLYDNQGRYAEAEPLFRRSLAIYEKALDPDHPLVATTLNNLAGLYRAQGLYAEAEPLLRHAVVIYENALGPYHPDVSTMLNNLGALYDDQGRYAEALLWMRQSTSILSARFTGAGVKETAGLISEQKEARWGFYAHIDLALRPELAGSLQ